ncbi:alpha/beta hydrolase fold domain-containing protein [Motiliproteus coralliicola]|nr:alpha/beta hydrolase fold domain-containing protein [Motiliproteus coralliicola]
MSLQNYILKKFLRHKYKPRFNAELDLDQARQELDSIINDFMPPPCDSLEINSGTIAGVPCEVIRPRDKAPWASFIYLHGGMFCLGSSLSHRGVTTELAKELGLEVIVLDYRLAPEHPYPAALDDADAVYRTLRDNIERLYIGGDQAGACLALLLLQRLRDEGVAMPELMVGLSGIYDLTLASPSHQSNLEHDCCNTPDVFHRGIAQFLPDDLDISPARVSPLLQPLDGLPPVLLQASGSEMLRDDSRRLAEAIKSVGGKVWHDEWADVPSCWHLAAVGLPEGRTALKRLGRQIKRLDRD